MATLLDFEFPLGNGKVIFGSAEAKVTRPYKSHVHTIELGEIDAQIASPLNDYANPEPFDQFEFEKANPEVWSVMCNHLIDLIAAQEI